MAENESATNMYDIEKARIEAIAKIVSVMIESDPSYAEKIEDVIILVSKTFRKAN